MLKTLENYYATITECLKQHFIIFKIDVSLVGKIKRRCWKIEHKR